MLDVTVIFKSGQSINFSCATFSTNVNKNTGELVGYSFEQADRKQGYPMYINTLEVEAIVISDSGEEESASINEEDTIGQTVESEKLPEETK